MKAENKGKLVRGVVAIGGRSSGCITTDPKRAEEFGNILAYTHWYRHDDDLDRLEKELLAITECYRKMPYTSGMMYGYEYKDYKKV